MFRKIIIKPPDIACFFVLDKNRHSVMDYYRIGLYMG